MDVIISNCAINLFADKDRVFGEAFRVLKSGGRFAVSDVVTKGSSPRLVSKPSVFSRTRIYRVDDARVFLAGEGIDVEAVAAEIDGMFMGAFVRAVKLQPCCAPNCCE